MDSPVYLIFGAAGGIGRALCERLLAQGANLLVNDFGTDAHGEGSDKNRVEELVSSLSEKLQGGARIVANGKDARDPEVLESCIDETYATFGRLDGVAYLAGSLGTTSLARTTDDVTRAILDLHLQAPLMLLSRLSSRWIERKNAGSLILASGTTAFFGAARQAALSAAHAGVIAAVRSAGVELRRYGIRVNAVAPLARTRLTESLPLFAGIKDNSMSPAHVAPVLSFLLSKRSEGISGESIGVAGDRIYALQSRETTGVFMDGVATEEELFASWSEIVRS